MQCRSIFRGLLDEGSWGMTNGLVGEASEWTRLERRGERYEVPLLRY